jgi:NAD-dependent deacetylase
VIWFDEELDGRQEARVRDFLAGGACDVVLVVGTTATFDYIRDWALEARGSDGLLVEVNPEDTALSAAADISVRERAEVALPRWLV